MEQPAEPETSRSGNTEEDWRVYEILCKETEVRFEKQIFCVFI